MALAHCRIHMREHHHHKVFYSIFIQYGLKKTEEPSKKEDEEER